MKRYPFNGDPVVTNTFNKKFHLGIDYAMPRRTAIVAVASGTVTKSRRDETRNWIANTENDPFKLKMGKIMVIRNLKNEDYGNYVKINHGNKISTLYAHLDECLVYENESVVEGQLIGYSDSTGNSTGDHLHFEIRKNDVCLNPDTFDYSFTGEGGVETQLHEKADRVEVTVPKLFVRSGPALRFPLSGSREVKLGDEIEISGYVEGEDYRDNKYWYRSKRGNYFWAGGTNKPDPANHVETNMTKAEYDEKKASLEARAEELRVATEQNQSDLAEFANVAVPEEVAAVEETPVTEEAVVEAEVVAEDPLKEEARTLIEQIKAKFGL